MTIYQKGEQYKDGEYPAILAVGDSWFWYPNNNILRALMKHPLMSSDYHVQAIGENGAMLETYVGDGKYAKDVNRQLEDNFRHGYNAFLISGAGNDAIKYGLALKDNCSAITTPSDCINSDALQKLLGDISSAIESLIQKFRSAFQNEEPKTRPIIIHGYDRSIPDGRGFELAGLKVTGPWLQRAMNDADVNPDLAFRTELSAALNNHLNDVFQRFHDPQNHVYYIDSRGTLSNGADYQNDWENELHPTPSGFDKIVDKCWIPVLQKLGMAKDRP